MSEMSEPEEVLREVARRAVRMEWVTGASTDGKETIIATNQSFEVTVALMRGGRRRVPGEHAYKVSGHDLLSGATRARIATDIEGILLAVNELLDW